MRFILAGAIVVVMLRLGLLLFGPPELRHGPALRAPSVSALAQERPQATESASPLQDTPDVGAPDVIVFPVPDDAEAEAAPPIPLPSDEEH